MRNKFLFTVVLISVCLLIFIAKTFAQEEYKTESFKVSKGGTLKIETSGGDIQVKTGNDNEVKLVYEDDDEYSGVTIHQEGNNITIKSDDYIDFEITVPSEYSLSLNTAGGDIEVLNNIKGRVKINTSGGDIKLKDVNGELTAITAGGDIRCGNINGDAEFSSGGGDVVVGKVEGECKVSTGGGNVVVENVTKSLTVSTGGGNVECGNIGSNLKIVTGGGNISANNISGAMTITTGGGNISGTGVSKGGTVVTGAGNVDLNNLSGNVTITSGAGNVMAEFVSIGNKESEILSGYGNITIYIPENAKVTIDASVKFAEGNVWSVNKKEISETIKSEFKPSSEDVNQKEGEFNAVYNVNGGGTKIYLQTSIGFIEIKKLKR